MSSNDINKSKENTDNNLDDEAIDFSDIKLKLSRNKKLVSFVTLGSLFFGSLYAFARDQIWRGQFQIVLSNSAPNSTIPQNVNVRRSLSFAREKINTQIEILKSPSVLKPIFEKIKYEKKSQGKNLDNLKYFDWLDESINIKLKRNTYVLDVYYQDTDRDLILPTLIEISETYQNFVNKGIKKQAMAKIKFLEDQVKIYKKKSAESFRKAQAFSFDNDISILKNPEIGDDEIRSVYDNNDFLVNSANRIRQINSQFDQFNGAFLKNSEFQQTNKITNVEDIRIKSAIKIDEIKRKIYDIESTDNEMDLIVVIRSIIPSSRTLSLIDQLDFEISNKEAIYKKNDRFIKNLYQKRTNLMRQLKLETLSTLRSNLNSEKSKYESAIRPKGVITKYKELNREAEYDLNIYLVTQKELRDQRINLSSDSYPWEIITEPTLDDYPIYPEKMKIILFSLFSGLFIGIIMSLVKEKKQGLIFSKDSFLKIFSINILELDVSLPEIEKKSLIKLFSESVVTKEKFNCILPVGSIPHKEVEDIRSILIKYSSNDLIIKRDISEVLENDYALLISKKGNVSNKDLSDFDNKIRIKGIKINWAVLI